MDQLSRFPSRLGQIPGQTGAYARKQKNALKKAFTSKEEFLRYIRTEDSEGTGAWSWVNVDLLPTPAEKRVWLSRNYIFFYSSLSLDSWTLGSGLVGIGLTWWQAIVAAFVAQSIGAAASALNSRCASVYHLGYPAVARSTFGMYGAYYAVFARAVLAVIYFALKVYTGSAFVGNMLQAVFGKSYTSIPNHVPHSIGMTTQGFLAFFLFWMIHIPFTLLRPNHLRWLFTLKMIVIVPTMVGLFTFCMVESHGVLGLNKITAYKTNSIGWLIMSGINSGLGTHSTLVANQPDFSRWSRGTWDSTWTLFCYPIGATVAATFGILSTAAINNLWGLKLWNQWDLLTAILDRYDHPSARFAVWLCAACWALLTLGTNVAANMIAFGSDCSMLLPRYLDMRRGQILVLLLAWPLFPWKVYSSAKVFNNFLSGYGLFMGGISGVMIAEYFLSRGNVFIPYLYQPGKSNTHYNYFRGWNVAAILAYIAGCIIPLPGFAGRLGASTSQTAVNIYYLGWLISFFGSILFYTACVKLFPTQNHRYIKSNNLAWEQSATSEDFDCSRFQDIDGTIVGHDVHDSTDEVITAELKS